MGKNRQKAKICTRDNWPQSLLQQDRWYIHYYQLCQEVAAATLDWQGVPVEIDTRFLTLTLFNRGLAVFFFDEDYDKYMALMGNPSGSLNMYNNPTSFTAYGAGGHFLKRMGTANTIQELQQWRGRGAEYGTFGMDECVPIWLNYYRTGMWQTFDLFAKKLAHYELCEQVNLQRQMMPAIIECDERIRMSVDNLIGQWQGGEAVIVGNDGLTSQMPMHYVFDEAPFILDKLQDAKNATWRQFLTLLGIDNSPIDKKAGVNEAEVTSNNGELDSMRLIRLDILRDACAKINRKYKLEMWVDFNTDYSSLNWATVNTAGGVEDGDFPAIEGGGENGNQLP